MPPRSPTNALMAADELMYVIGNRSPADDRRWRRRSTISQLVPAGFELIDRGHVGHRAAGREVGQNHLLMRRRQHVGAFGHEVHAAEDDEFGFGMLRDLAGQPERVAGVVGELDHFVALIVMAEDDQPGAERRLGRGDAAVELLVGQTEISLGERLALRDMRLLELRQDRKQRRHLNYQLYRLAVT